MDKKVILISIDGMRPDGLKAAGNPFLEYLEKNCTYTYTGSSADPSVTLPCHYTMAHSVSPQRHGILTNTYVPEVRPVVGIFDKVSMFGGVSAFFYGWDPIRDIAKPGAFKFTTHIQAYMSESVDTELTDEALRVIGERKPDLAFLYLVDTDDKGGHDNGWMTDEYLRRVSIAIDNTKRIFDAFGDEYSIIIMADHGGHDRSHGTTMPEDMTIPFFFYGEDFEKGKEINGISLLDIAPTIAKLLGIPPEKEWEGKSVC